MGLVLYFAAVKINVTKNTVHNWYIWIGYIER